MVFPTFYSRETKKLAIVRVKFGNKNLMRHGLTRPTFMAYFFLLMAILEYDYLIENWECNFVTTTFRMCCIQVFIIEYTYILYQVSTLIPLSLPICYSLYTNISLLQKDNKRV